MDAIRYATLAQGRSEIKETDATATAGDPYVLAALAHVSARIDIETGRTFAPFIEMRYFDAIGEHIDPVERTLLLDRPLLAVTSVTVNGTALVAGTDYLPVPRSGTPITGLRIPASSGHWWGEYSGDWKDSIAVTGIWGYHTYYAGAWLASGDTVQATLAAAADYVQVQDASALDSLRRSPRFSPGQLLRFGATLDYAEVLEVDTDTSPDRLYLRRNARGSTAIEHAATTPISIWQPEAAIERAALRWVGYLYKRRGSFENTQFDGVTVTTFPPDMPKEVEDILETLTEYTFGGV